MSHLSESSEDHLDNSKEADRALFNSLCSRLREIERTLYADRQIGREPDASLSRDKSEIVGRLRRMGYLPEFLEELCAGYRRECEHVHRRKSTATAFANQNAGAIARNLDRLRMECGWSFEKLASETGIDKKLILSHVNKGAKPHPRILKEYAQAFSKALGRSITAPDLQK